MHRTGEDESGRLPDTLSLANVKDTDQPGNDLVRGRCSSRGRAFLPVPDRGNQSSRDGRRGAASFLRGQQDDEGLGVAVQLGGADDDGFPHLHGKRGSDQVMAGE